MDATWFRDPGPDDLGFDGQCNARKVKNLEVGNGRCRLAAGFKTTHPGLGPCCFHGGATPQASRKYERVGAGLLLNAYGLAREGDCDPRDLLMEELARTAGTIDYLQLVLSGFTEDELLGVVPAPSELKTGEGKDGPYWELVEKVGVPVLLELYRWERTHLAKLSVEATKLGLLERAVRVEEAQATLVAAAFGRALEAQGLAFEVVEAVKASFRTELLSLEAASSGKVAKGS